MAHVETYTLQVRTLAFVIEMKTIISVKIEAMDRHWLHYLYKMI